MKAIALLVLVSCANAPPFAFVKSCGPIDGFKDVRTQAKNQGCGYIEGAVKLSRRMIVASGIATDEQVTTERGKLDGLGVLATDRFWFQGQEVLGVSLPYSIVVGSTVGSVLHEEIHEGRMQNGAPGREEVAHLGWHDLGFYALTDFFHYEWASWRRCDALKPLLPEQRAGLADAGFDVATWESTPCE